MSRACRSDTATCIAPSWATAALQLVFNEGPVTSVSMQVVIVMLSLPLLLSCSLLTNMRFSDSAELTAAGTAALTAVCALNRPNTVAYLRELVHRLLQHEPKVRLTVR